MPEATIYEGEWPPNERMNYGGVVPAGPVVVEIETTDHELINLTPDEHSFIRDMTNPDRKCVLEPNSKVFGERDLMRRTTRWTFIYNTPSITFVRTVK